MTGHSMTNELGKPRSDRRTLASIFHQPPGDSPRFLRFVRKPHAIAWRLIALHVFSNVAVSSGNYVYGQVEDVFGAPPAAAAPATVDQAAAVPPNDSSNASALREEHVVVQGLRQSPPETPFEIGRAILYMVRIGRMDEVGKYLDQLAKLNLDPATATKLERAAGWDTWLRLSTLPEGLTDAQRGVAKRVLDGASNAARDPAALERALGQLRSQALVDRKRGVLAIQSAGQSGLAALLQSVATTDELPTPIHSETIATLGPEGELALRAALQTSDAKAFERLIVLASRIPGSAYMAELATAFHRIPTQSEAHTFITRALSPAGQTLPQPTATHRFLMGQLDSELREYTILRRDATPATHSIWRWSSDGKRLVAELDDTAGIHLERSFQLARLVHFLNSAPDNDAALATAVILERHYRLTRQFLIDPSENASQIGSHAPPVTLDALGTLMDVAKRKGLMAAELRAMQWTRLHLAKPAQPDDRGAVLSRLADRAKTAPPPIRYTAVAAMTQFANDQTSLTGQYGYESTRREMQKLEALPLALVIGGAGNVRDALIQHLTQLGVRSLEASGSRDALRTLQDPQPIELIFIVDRTSEMRLSELIQRLRAVPRTADLPLAVMTDHVSADARTLLADEGVQGIHYASVTTNIEYTAALVREMYQRSPLPTMDAVDRLTFRSLVEPLAP